MKEPKPVPKEYIEDFDWAYQHYSEWTKKYPGMWIAVAGKKVLIASKNLGEVEEKAHREVEEKAHRIVDREDIPYIFIEEGVHVY